MAHSDRYVSRNRREEISYRRAGLDVRMMVAGRGQRPLSRIYCTGCNRLFFEGDLNSWLSRVRFKAAQNAALNHDDVGHAVIYERPETTI